MQLRWLLSLLLVVVVVFSMSQHAFNPVGGQVYSTPVTTLVTRVYYTSSTGGLTTFTTTEMGSPPASIYSGPFSFKPSVGGRMYGCFSDGVPFQAEEGQYVSGTFTSDQPVTFYIMTLQNAAGFSKCDEIPPVITGSGGNVRAYSFNVMIPQSGQWMLFFLVGGMVQTHVNINLNANLSAGRQTTYVATQQIVSKYYQSSIVQVTEESYIFQTVQQSSYMSSLQMPQTPQSANSQSTNKPLTADVLSQLVLVIVAIAAIALGALLLYSRRTTKPKTTQTKKSEPRTKKVESKPKKAKAKMVESETKKVETITSTYHLPPSKNFCIECGKEIEVGSKFCNNCGSKQL